MQRDGLTPEQLQRVLLEAIEIDEKTKTRYSEAEIRYSAAQVGVSDEALATALANLERVPLPAEVSQPAGLLQVARKPAGLGFLVGGLNAALFAIAVVKFEQHSAMLVPVWIQNALMIGSGAMTLLSVGDRNVRKFLARNLGLWFGFGMGVLVVGKFVGADNVLVGAVINSVLKMPIIAFGISSAVGVFMMSRQKRASGTNGGDTANPVTPGVLRRAWTSLKEVLNRPIAYAGHVRDLVMRGFTSHGVANVP